MSLVGTIAAFCCCTVEEGGICCRGDSEECECIEGLTREECEDANGKGLPFDTGAFFPGIAKCPDPDVPDEENICLTGCCVTNVINSSFTCIDQTCIDECFRRGTNPDEATFTIPINTCGDDPPPCDFTGACCLPSGQCVDNLNAATCEGLEGEFHPQQTCAMIECDEDALVNCCLPDDTCVEQITLQSCLGQGGHTIGQTPCNTQPDPCMSPGGFCCNKAQECGTVCLTIPAIAGGPLGSICSDGLFGPICFSPCPSGPLTDYLSCVIVENLVLCCDDTPLQPWQNLGGGSQCVPGNAGVHGSCVVGGPADCQSVSQVCINCALGNEWQADLQVVWAADIKGQGCVCSLCACTATVFFPCPPNNCPTIGIFTNISGPGCFPQ